MVRDRAGRTACHRLLERPQAPLCLGSQTAPSHPTSSRYRSNAESRIDLADAPLKDLDRVAEAEPLLRRALDIRERVLGLEHPDVATSLGNLAVILTMRGRSAEVEPLLRRALDIRERVLGPEHRDVANLLGNLAMVL